MIKNGLGKNMEINSMESIKNLISVLIKCITAFGVVRILQCVILMLNRDEPQEKNDLKKRIRNIIIFLCICNYDTIISIINWVSNRMGIGNIGG